MKIKWLVLLIFFSINTVASAQSDLPLVIHINGQLYRWSIGDSAPTPTGCDLQGNRLRLWDYSLVLSPQGDWAAFIAPPEGIYDSAQTSMGNLWVCNVNTGEAYVLSKFESGLPDAVSEGAFSPDGTRIVWTENNEEANPAAADMFVHDFATRETTRIAADMPLTTHCSILVGAPRVIWGEAGIVVGYERTANGNTCNLIVETGFSHYAEDGTLLNSFPVESIDFRFFEWLSNTTEPTIAFIERAEYTNGARLYSMNMMTGIIQEEDAAIEAYIPNSDASAGRYLLALQYDTQNPPLIYLPGGDVPLQAAADVALSADAEWMAIVLGRNLYFARSGFLEPVSWNAEYYPMAGEGDYIHIPDNQVGQFEVAWAAPSYQLVGMPASVCPSVPILFVGEVARISTGLGANNLRDAPYPSAALIASIAEGSNVFLVDSYDFSPFYAHPVEVCSEGIRWREVMFGEELGWTAESQGDTYYMDTE